MRDILGRELKDGDLCVGMAIGRNSSGMHIGIFKGLSVVHLSYSETSLCKSSTSNTYLIENPTEQEMIIKDKIQKLLDEEEKERKRKANSKTIPLSKLEVGGIYKTTQGEEYVYLGKRKFTFENLSNRMKNEQEGNCFAFVYNAEDKTDDKILEDMLTIWGWNTGHNIHVLKGNKKLTEMVRKVNLNFPIVKTEEFTNYYGKSKYRLIIE